MRYSQFQKPLLGTPLNLAHPLATGLGGCWLMNEGSGDKAYDSCLYRRHCNLVSGAMFYPSGVLLDATNDHGNFGTSPLLYNGLPFSLTWEETVTSDANNYPSRFALQVSSGTQFLMLRDKTGVTYKGIVWGNSPSTLTANFPLSAMLPSSDIGKRVQYTLVCLSAGGTAAGNYIFYRNAQLVPVGQGQNLGTLGGAVNRFGYDGGDGGADCGFGFIFLHNRALTPQEVWQLYATPYAMFERTPSWMRYVAAPSGVLVPGPWQINPYQNPYESGAFR
jgi:hypothetical protein